MKILPHRSEQGIEDLWAGCAWATFFQHPAWFRLFVELNPGWEFVIATPSGSDARACALPLLRRRLENGQFRYEAGPWHTYAAVLAKDDEAPRAEIRDFLSQLLTHEDTAYSVSLHGNPLADLGDAPPYRSLAQNSRMIALSADVETIRAAYHSSFRRGLRKAGRAGIEVRTASCLEDWDAYHDLYEMTQRRWGDRATSHYPPAFFQLMSELPGDLAKLWLAVKDDRICSGAVVLYGPGAACYWHGASDEASFDLRPNNLLHDRIIEDCLASGIGRYDMMPSGGHEGVDTFKARLGADAVHFTEFTWTASKQQRAFRKLKGFFSR